MRNKSKYIKRIVTSFLSVLTIVSNAQNPNASFITNKTKGCAPLTIQFTNTSLNASSFYWDLGNGNTSVLKNPSNVYSVPGTYVVKLIAISRNGQKDSVISKNLILVEPNPVADFHAVNTSSWTGGGIVAFVNTSLNSTTHLWDFGDGYTSILKDASHSYSSEGVYTVKLITYNNDGCVDLNIMANYINVTPKVSPTFTVNTTNACSLNQILEFTSTTPSANSWFWNFGDGGTSTLQHPTHIYKKDGIYTVSLTTSSLGSGIDSVIKNNYITVSANQTPQITTNTNTPCLGLPVSFSNTADNIKSWLWNFGDNETSTQQNPTHTYRSIGNYDISLTIITNSNCQYATTIKKRINVQNNAVSNFTLNNKTGCVPLNVQFTNLSKNDTARLWEFGDGATSTQQNPSHTYTEEGTYSVTLRSFNPSGCTSVYTIPNAVTIASPLAKFNADNRIGCPPAKIIFKNLSGNSNQWFWDFGDGNTSTLENPTHTYNSPGNYDVSLISLNAQGCSDTLMVTSFIQINSTVVNYTPPPTTTGCVPLNAAFEMDMPDAVSWRWEFGDGNTSNLKTPVHTYTRSGFFTVSLTVLLNTGCAKMYSNFKSFDVQGGPAEFTFTKTNCPPYIVNFKDTTYGNPVSWSWNFGDGTISSLQNPIHTYSKSGFYTVVYTATTSNGCISRVVESNLIQLDTCATTAILDSVPDMIGGIGAPLISKAGNITAVRHSSPPISGCTPLLVNFHNTTSAKTSWFWDFGDGSTSTLENPTHNYVKNGDYDITMVARDNAGKSDTLIYSNYIHASGIETNFSFTQNSDCVNTQLIFTDSSKNAVSWFWDFGDGTTDTKQNPSHNYKVSGKGYNIQLTTYNVDGCSSSMSSNYTSVIDTPLVAADNFLVCGNQSVTFNCSSTTSRSFVWDFGDGSTSTLKDPSHVYTTEGIFPVKLKLTNNNGCVRDFSLASPILVQYPIADFTSALKSGCNSTSVIFSNASLGSSHSKWDFGDGSPTEYTDSTIHTYTQPGTYQVKLIVNTDKKCSSNITKTVRVYPTVVANFSSAQNTTCFPISVSYSDSSTKAVTWLWEFGDRSTSNLQNPVHTFAQPPLTDVKLTITDTIGCQASIMKPNISVFKTNFSVSASKGCAPLKVDFTDQSVHANTWLWNFGDGTISTLQNPSHVYTNNGTYPVQLISSTHTGCVDTMTFTSIITNKPTANFSSKNPTNCSPTLVSFNDSSVNAISWLWDFGDGSSSTNQNPAHIYNIPGLYTIKLIVANTEGCTDTMMRVNYIKVPGTIANFSTSTKQFCAQSVVNFKDSSINASSWTWNFGDGNTSSIQNPSNTYQNAGHYTVSLIVQDAFGCTSNFTLTNPIAIHPLPISNFSVSDSSFCPPRSVSFNNRSQNATSYSWHFGNGDTSNLQAPTRLYLSPGIDTISLIATNEFGCSDTSTNNSVVANRMPVANFTTNTTEGCSKMLVSFSDSSEVISNGSYFWDFGNGTTSKEKNPSTTFIDHGNYSISLIVSDSNGCKDTVTKPAFIKIRDLNPPAASTILCATVISDSSTYIIWEPSKASDFSYYEIYRKNISTGNYISIGKVISKLKVGFADTTLNTLANSYCYKIQTVDACGYALPLDSLKEHCTINVTAKGVGEHIQVSWTPYVGASVSTYSIYRMETSGSKSVLITTVPSSVLTITDTTMYCPLEYSYRIKANNLNKNFIGSNSDTSITKQGFNILSQQKVDVVRSTVINNSEVLIEWNTPTIVPKAITGYSIYRSTDNENFIFLTDVPPTANQYIDKDLDVNTQNYFYKIEAKNTCNVVARTSNESSSILLTAELIDGSTQLNWTKYEGWDMGVEYYIIEKMNEKGEWEMIKKVDGNQLNYQIGQ